MKTLKMNFSILFLNFCCNLPLILAIFTQMMIVIINLSINYYSNPVLLLNCSLISFLFYNIFAGVLMVLFAFFLLLIFFLGFNRSVLVVSLISSIFFSIDTAFAGEIVISADTHVNQKPIPLSPLIDAALNKNFKRYNELADLYNLGSYFGKNVSSLNMKYPFLNSHFLIHQAFLPENSANFLTSTDSFIPHEAAYLYEGYLTDDQLNALYNEKKRPIIHFDIEWRLYCNNIYRYKLDEKAQFVLNNYSQADNFFAKSSDKLRVLRLGDFQIFTENSVISSTEFKTSHKAINPFNLEKIFQQKFFKSFPMNHQLLDISEKKIYSRTFDDSQIKMFNLKSFQVNDMDLTEKFTVSRKISLTLANQPRLQYNVVSNNLSNIFQYVIKR